MRYFAINIFTTDMFNFKNSVKHIVFKYLILC